LGGSSLQCNASLPTNQLILPPFPSLATNVENTFSKTNPLNISELQFAGLCSAQLIPRPSLFPLSAACCHHRCALLSPKLVVACTPFFSHFSLTLREGPACLQCSGPDVGGPCLLLLQPALLACCTDPPLHSFCLLSPSMCTAVADVSHVLHTFFSLS